MYPVLWFLNLSHNKIEFIQGDYFENMPFIDKIDFSHNRLMQFPLDLSTKFDYYPWTGYLPKFVSRLNFSNNHLTYIPVTVFSYLDELLYLDLGSNQIAEIGNTSFSDLSKLVTLDISVNSIKGISLCENPLGNGSIEHQRKTNCSLSILQGLANLRTLNVSQNSIRYILQTDFGDLTRLETLDLSQNRITFLSHSVFKRLNSLICLILRGNHIQMIEPSTFLPLHQVNSISLEDNNLSDLSDKLFGRNYNLTLLQLHNNSLTAVPLVVSWTQHVNLSFDINTCMPSYRDRN